MLSQKPRCPLCEAQGNTATLLLCQGCRVTHYCGRDHQAADKDSHKLVCNAVEKAAQKLGLAKTTLHNKRGKLLTPLWVLLDYTKARCALIEAILKIKTYAAVQAAHYHATACLRMWHSNDIYVHHMLPALKLRLGLDQECYDFIKWYATREEKGEYARGNMDNSFLHLRGEDVFEKLPVTMSHRSADLSHTVALTLLKLRLKLDIGVLQQSWIIGSKVPQEVMDNIQKHVVGDTVSWRKDIIGASDLTPLNKELDQQIQALIKAVETQNPYFWYGLFRPEIHLTPCSKSYTSGSPEEVRRVLQFSFDSWIETPGAMDLMRELLHGKV